MLSARPTCYRTPLPLSADRRAKPALVKGRGADPRGCFADGDPGIYATRLLLLLEEK